MIEAQVWTGVDASGRSHEVAVFLADPGRWEVLGESARGYETAAKAARVNLTERRGLDIRHLYGPGEVIPAPRRLWKRWPNTEGPWWMNTVREGTVAVVADGSFLPGEFHVRRCDDITGQYLDYDATDDALFTELDAAPEPTRQPATKGYSR